MSYKKEYKGQQETNILIKIVTSDTQTPINKTNSPLRDWSMTTRIPEINAPNDKM